MTCLNWIYILCFYQLQQCFISLQTGPLDESTEQTDVQHTYTDIFRYWMHDWKLTCVHTNCFRDQLQPVNWLLVGSTGKRGVTGLLLWTLRAGATASTWNGKRRKPDILHRPLTVCVRFWGRPDLYVIVIYEFYNISRTKIKYLHLRAWP